MILRNVKYGLIIRGGMSTILGLSVKNKGEKRIVSAHVGHILRYRCPIRLKRYVTDYV